MGWREVVGGGIKGNVKEGLGEYGRSEEGRVIWDKKTPARDDGSFTIRRDGGRLPNAGSLLSNSVSSRPLKSTI